MGDHNALASAFVQQYYALFDKKQSREQVGALYHPTDSLLSYEGAQIVGAQAIVTKYSGLPFNDMVHIPTTVDAQPLSGGSPGVVIQVVGQLKTDAEHDKPMGYAQTFVLRPFNNSYFIFNDTFRLTLHNM